MRKEQGILGLRRNGWLQKWLHWEVINKCLRTTRALSLLHLCVVSFLRCDYQPGKPAVGRNVAWVSQHCTLTRTHAHFYSAQLALPFSFACTSRYATPSTQCFTAERTHTHTHTHTHIHTGFPDRLGFTVAYPHTFHFRTSAHFFFKPGTPSSSWPPVHRVTMATIIRQGAWRTE